MNETNNEILSLLFEGYTTDIILCYLFKYKIINENVFNLFCLRRNIYLFELINFFYFNEEGYFFNNKC